MILKLHTASAGAEIYIRAEHIIAVMLPNEQSFNVPPEAQASVLVVGSLSYLVRESVYSIAVALSALETIIPVGVPE